MSHTVSDCRNDPGDSVIYMYRVLRLPSPFCFSPERVHISLRRVLTITRACTDIWDLPSCGVKRHLRTNLRRVRQEQVTVGEACTCSTMRKPLLLTKQTLVKHDVGRASRCCGVRTCSPLVSVVKATAVVKTL